jgi:uncharacterized repeat protein (TIGR01451 family)
MALDWSGPAKLQLGVPETYTLNVRNTSRSAAHQVLVRVTVPAGLGVVQTTPEAPLNARVMAWDLGTMQPGDERRLVLRLTAETGGELTPSAWVTFTGGVPMTVKALQPRLAVQVSAPEPTPVGDLVAFRVKVQNPGDGDLQQVALEAVLSDGLTHSVGPKVPLEVGEVKAGEVHELTVLCHARSEGLQTCKVCARAKGGLKCEDEGHVRVLLPHLAVRLSGPTHRYLGRKATYTIQVANPATVTARAVNLTEAIPEGIEVVSATGAKDAAGGNMVWSLGDIPAGQTREVQFEAWVRAPSEVRHQVRAEAAGGWNGETELVTHVEGLSALQVELADSDDPIEVQGEVVYLVRLANTCSKAETNLRVVATVPRQMVFLSAEGPVSHHKEGDSIVFEAIDELAPQAKETLRIHVRAREAGTVRFKIEVTSTNVTEPVVKMEATRIYDDAPQGSSTDPR